MRLRAVAETAVCAVCCRLQSGGGLRAVPGARGRGRACPACCALRPHPPRGGPTSAHPRRAPRAPAADARAPRVSARARARNRTLKLYTSKG